MLAATIWASDPKIARFGNPAPDMLSVSWPLTLDPASAAVFANFTAVRKFASTLMEATAATHRAQQQFEWNCRRGGEGCRAWISTELRRPVAEAVYIRGRH